MAIRQNSPVLVLTHPDGTILVTQVTGILDNNKQKLYNNGYSARITTIENNLKVIEDFLK